MVIKSNDTVHIITRRAFEQDLRRHFVGTIIAVDGSVARVGGYAFVFDAGKSEFARRPEPRMRVFDLASAGYIVNLLPDSVEVGALGYQMSPSGQLELTDGEGFTLDINEFGPGR